MQEKILTWIESIHIKYVVIALGLLIVIIGTVSFIVFSSSTSQEDKTTQEEKSQQEGEEEIAESEDSDIPSPTKSITVTLTPIKTITKTPTPTPQVTSTPTHTQTPTPTTGGSSTTGQTADVYMTLSSQTVSVNQQFPVIIKVNTGGQSTNAVDITLTYPDTLLEYVSSDGSSSSFPFALPGSSGNGSINIQRGSTSPVSGDLVIISLTFKAKSMGTADITFGNQSKVVSSSTGENMIRTLTSGRFTIQ